MFPPPSHYTGYLILKTYCSHLINVLFCCNWPKIYPHLSHIITNTSKNTLNLVSFNTNGLGQARKRSIIFNKLKPLNSITLLQETHCTKAIEKSWENEWGWKIYFSNGSSSSTGVATLFPPNFEFVLCDKWCDFQGRILILKIKINEEYYVICNVYAPTQDHRSDQINFAIQLKNALAPFSLDKILIGGDLNFTSSKLDKLDTMSSKNENLVYKKQVFAIMESMDLCDSFRELYPEKRRYTWHARGKSSRLDYFLISDFLLNDLTAFEIAPGLHSDHSILKIKLGNDPNQRGKGLWKFNTSLIHDCTYVNNIKKIVNECSETYKDHEDKSLVWEMTKMKVRAFSVPYCVRKKREKVEFKKQLEHDLEELQRSMDSNPNQQTQEVYYSSKNELEKIEKDELKSQIMRSKIKWTEDGEKNSKFFLSLEKRNYLNKVISNLEIDGKIIHDPKEISEAQTMFYKKLYSEQIDEKSSCYSDSLNDFLKNNDMPKLSEEQKTKCDNEISEKEILNSIKQLANGKTPGSDGLPADFYKFFWTDIKQLLIDSIKYSMKKGELSIEQKRGIITLLPKKHKNRLLLKNWRPISLLNTDYKIIAKMLAIRLQEVLPSIINDDQSGYLKGRYIGQNIRILEDVSFFTQSNNLPGILLSIDFEKAFDSINWNFLFNTLQHVNFGNIFINYIKTMYNDIQSTILNNGSTGSYFKLQRGVRQGCPLSAFLFILCLETLANKIRNDKNIKGIKLGNREIKISLLADDITLILADLDSVKNSLNVLKLFTKCAGLKINVEKTQAKHIGSLITCDHYPHGLSWIKTPIETLGIVITDSEDSNYKCNFQQRIVNLKAVLNIWKTRKLSLKGKITILNNLALAPLIYVSSVVSTPDLAIKEINNTVQNFIWDGSTAKIAQKSLIQSIEKGGLKLCHFGTKVVALQLSWVKRLVNNTNSTWKVLPKYFYKTKDLEMYFSSAKTIPKKEKIPIFYKTITSNFFKYFKQPPQTIIEILNEPIWQNEKIKCHFNEILFQNNITQIKHLVNDKCEFMNVQELNKSFNIKVNFLHLVNITSNIPKEWRSLLNNCSCTPKNIPDTFHINIRGTTKCIEKTHCKDLYWHIINCEPHSPACINKWQEYYIDFEQAQASIWSEIFKRAFSTLRDTKLQMFQYRVLHRTIPCNQWLNNLKIKDSATCSFCSEKDDIPHFLLKCKNIEHFWLFFFNWWKNLTNIDIINNVNELEECIIFGFPTTNDIVLALNYCILHAKHYIYIQKLLENNNPELYVFQIKLKQALDIEYEICRKNNNEKAFKKFEFIHQAL